MPTGLRLRVEPSYLFVMQVHISGSRNRISYPFYIELAKAARIEDDNRWERTTTITNIRNALNYVSLDISGPT